MTIPDVVTQPERPTHRRACDCANTETRCASMCMPGPSRRPGARLLCRVVAGNRPAPTRKIGWTPRPTPHTFGVRTWGTDTANAPKIVCRSAPSLEQYRQRFALQRRSPSARAVPQTPPEGAGLKPARLQATPRRERNRDACEPAQPWPDRSAQSLPRWLAPVQRAMAP